MLAMLHARLKPAKGRNQCVLAKARTSNPGQIRYSAFSFARLQIAVHFGCSDHPWRQAMVLPLPELDIDQLTVPQRLELIALLWDSIPDSLDALPVPEWHRQE